MRPFKSSKNPTAATMNELKHKIIENNQGNKPWKDKKRKEIAEKKGKVNPAPQGIGKLWLERELGTSIR